LTVAGHEQARQEEQAGEPDRHAGDVCDLEPQVHRRRSFEGVRPRAWRALLGLLPCIVPQGVWAAGELPGDVPTLGTAWSLAAVPALLLLAGLYGAGLVRLWRGGRAGRGVSRAEASLFGAGLLVLGLALVWPVDAYG